MYVNILYFIIKHSIIQAAVAQFAKCLKVRLLVPIIHRPMMRIIFANGASVLVRVR